MSFFSFFSFVFVISFFGSVGCFLDWISSLDILNTFPLFIYFHSRISIILDCKAFFPLFSLLADPYLLHQPPFQATSVFRSSSSKNTLKLHLIS